MAHKHAASMALYAQDATETDEPWTRWKFRRPDGKWMPLNTHPSWVLDVEYRRKPKTIKVNGFEVPEPLKEMPERGDVWLAIPHSESFAQHYCADCMRWKQIALDRGLLHSTKEAAVAHSKAMLGIDPGAV